MPPTIQEECRRRVTLKISIGNSRISKLSLIASAVPDIGRVGVIAMNMTAVVTTAIGIIPKDQKDPTRGKEMTSWIPNPREIFLRYHKLHMSAVALS